MYKFASNIQLTCSQSVSPGETVFGRSTVSDNSAPLRALKRVFSWVSLPHSSVSLTIWEPLTCNSMAMLSIISWRAAYLLSDSGSSWLSVCMHACSRIRSGFTCADVSSRVCLSKSWVVLTAGCCCILVFLKNCISSSVPLSTAGDDTACSCNRERLGKVCRCLPSGLALGCLLICKAAYTNYFFEVESSSRW